MNEQQLDTASGGSDIPSADLINVIKTNIAKNATILIEIKANEENFLLQYNKKREIEEQLPQIDQQGTDHEVGLRQELATLEQMLQQYKSDFDVSIQQFGQTIAESLSHASTLHEQIISALAIWREMDPKSREELSYSCGEISEINEKIHEQLKEIEIVLQTGVMQTDNSAELSFTQSCIAEILRIKEELSSNLHFQIIKKRFPAVPTSNNINQAVTNRHEAISQESSSILEMLENIRLSVTDQQYENMQQFQQAIVTNLSKLSSIQETIILKLTTWKYEQQQMANGISDVGHSDSLDMLQRLCEELAELLYISYQQLKGAVAVVQSVDAVEELAAFTSCHIDQTHKLLQDLLNHSMIVEQQPPQVIRIGIKFPHPVIVSLLVGKRLNFLKNTPIQLSTSLIVEEQAASLQQDINEPEFAEVQNGNGIIYRQKNDDNDDFKRITFNLLRMRVMKRQRGLIRTQSVAETKTCFLFKCSVVMDSITFKVRTISLPVVLLTHPVQEAMAEATISWDNAFGEFGRVPFQVSLTASWNEVAEKILKPRCVEQTGKDLSQDHLAYLRRKAFRGLQPQPETITWAQICEDNIPKKSFTFWNYFYATLNVLKGKDLNDLWKRDLIMGFVEKQTVETLLVGCETGTFLLRLSESYPGAIVISFVHQAGNICHLLMHVETRNSSSVMKTTMFHIKENELLKLLHQPTGSIHKDAAFGDFY